MLITDIGSKESFGSFVSSECSVILMTPRWSAYPQASLELLESILQELGSNNINVFTVTEDEPNDNPVFAQWLNENKSGEIELLPSISTGAGSLVVCRYGKPIHVERTTCQWSASQLQEAIFSAFS